ncbi:DUF1574 domain-containing protein [Reichenbachiella agariperforans]|uniref:DUF1574 domain-containing protein n=1 Tax=Reichenbachiella agariperforans TaxID=156994 RepID=UPI001C0A3BB3|nr:DUF1574 domain-containing protein [Reichenbachiella agariperforans]MBU2915203.1 DUF1574 domain-containing protein [Reichenbachiella agariperforans]
MKSLITKILTFLPILGVVYCVMVIALANTPIHYHFKKNLRTVKGGYGHMHSRIEEINTLDSIDILVVGSSHAYRGFDPRLIHVNNHSIFNLGSSSQTPIQTGQLLKTYVPKLNPKVILYEVFPATFSSDGVEASLDLLSNAKIDFEALKMAVKVGDIRTYNALIICTFDQILNLNNNFKEPNSKKGDEYISGGYVQKELKTFSTPDSIKHINWKIKPKQLNAFVTNIEYLKQCNVKTILVLAPITEKLYRDIENIAYYDSLFRSLGEDYLNFNTLNMALDDSLHYYDLHHLNQNGVEVFNQQLTQELEQLIY